MVQLFHKILLDSKQALYLNHDCRLGISMKHKKTLAVTGSSAQIVQPTSYAGFFKMAGSMVEFL